MSADAAALLAVAESGARLAGAILRERFHAHRTIEFKGGIDLVTDADKASERALLDHLRSYFPSHAVLAEESGASAGADVRWIVDPLDGTTNYAHQVPHFCVSIAAQATDGLAAAAIYDPIRDELFSAARGSGATLNGKPMRVSPVTTLDRAVLCTGFPYDVREKPDAPVGLFNRIIRRAQAVRRMGSAALDLAYVASGRFDGFFEFGLKPWDTGAGALLVREAGGTIAQVDGSPFDVEIGDVVCAGPGVFAALAAETDRFCQEIGWQPRPFGRKT